VLAGIAVLCHGMAETASTYDELPYTGLAYWFSHPDHLGLVGALHGIATARSPSCRVLEVGCGDGGNILSLASLLPGSTFVGLDLSEVHIRQGQQTAAEVGLTNVSLHHADLTKFEVEPGTFDFVIAHGLYSWVPEFARDGLLALIRRALKPTGVAVVSYNTLPGQALFEPVRSLMRFHTAPLTDANAKVRQARAIANAWCDHFVTNDSEGRGAVVKRLAMVVKGLSPMMVRHDYLSEFEHPIWFSDFVAHANRHGLAYLDNALPSAQRPELLEPAAREMLAQLEDRVRAQQYFDHFDNTRFRVTLLARADAPRTEPLSLSELALEDRLDVEQDPATVNPTPRVVLDTASGEVEIRDMATRISLAFIFEQAPRPVPMRELRDAVMGRLRVYDPDSESLFTLDEAGRDLLLAHLEAVLSELWRRDVVHRWRDPPNSYARRPDHPETGKLQRVLARRGAPISSLYHRFAQLDDKARELLAALDGTLDIATLSARFGPDTEKRISALRRERLLFG